MLLTRPITRRDFARLGTLSLAARFHPPRQSQVTQKKN